jgi:hypothetical protein
MDGNDELMAELKAIMDQAGESLSSDQETHMVTTLRAMEQVWWENHYDLAPYALFVLSQAEEGEDEGEMRLDPMGIEGDSDATLAKCSQAFSTDEFSTFVMGVTDLTATVALATGGHAYGYATRTVLEDGSVFSVLAANAGVAMVRRHSDRIGTYFSEYGDLYTIDAPDDLTKQESTMLAATVMGWTLPKRLASAFPLGFKAMGIEAMMKIRDVAQQHREDDDNQ